MSDAGGRSVLDSSWRLPGYLGEQGKDELGELCSILREELAACHTQKQVAHVNRTTMKMVCEGSGDDHVSGRLAYRLKEAVRDIGSVSNYAALDCRHQLAFRKVLQLEVRRRQAEIAGWNEQAAEELALVTELIDKEYGSQALVPPLEPALGVQPKLEIVIPVAPRTPQSESTSGSPKRVRQSVVAAKPGTSGIMGDCLTTHRAWMEEHPSSPSMPQQPREEEELSRVAKTAGVPEVGPGHSKKIEDLLAETDIVAQKEKAHNDDENQIVKVFNNLAEMSGIIKDNIAPALRLLGMPEPDQAWIDEVFEGITKFATLTEAEFMKFVTRFVNRRSKAYAQAFFECDADKSGEVEYEELRVLLTRFNITPMPHVLDEVIKEVDKDRSGALSLREFESVMDLVRFREGFTKAEYAVLVDTFGKFDYDKSGEIQTKEIDHIILWLGFAYNAEKVDSIVKEVDFDGGGSLTVVEFLACMRKMRENELKQIDEIMNRLDFDGDGRTGVEELRPLIGSLGYMVDMDAILESGVKAGAFPSRDKGDLISCGLDVVQVWQLLVVYRSHEGFSAADTKDIKAAFNKYDKAGQGEMTIVEASKVLRWLGFTPSFEVHQNLVSKVDIDNSGKLEFIEFLKMVRILQSGEEHKIMDAFRRADHRQTWDLLTSAAPGFLLKENALEALVDAGIAHPELQFEDFVILTDGRLGVAMDSFIRVATRIQKEARRDYRKNSGFSSDEIQEMQECFDYFDADGSGDVSCKETVQLIEELFPNQAHDPKVRPKLVQLMIEVDSDSSGSLNFSDFLHLMQELQELKMQERITRELAAFEECQFTMKEMEEFRELFLSSGNEGGETESLSFPHVQKMLGALFPLGEKNIGELTAIVRGIVGRDGGLFGEPVPAVDFPDFLRLMRRLLDVNFAQLQETIAETAKLQQKEAARLLKIAGAGR